MKNSLVTGGCGFIGSHIVDIPFNIYNAGTGKNHSIMEIAEMVGEKRYNLFTSYRSSINTYRHKRNYKRYPNTH